MAKGYRKCVCCGQEYKFCPHCAEYDSLPRWMGLYHNENCKNLSDTTTRYLLGSITAEEAKKQYSECDLSYKYKLKKSIVDAINEVNRLTKKKNKKEKNIVDEVKVNDIEEIKVDEIKVEEVNAEEISSNE